jgi:hypothetical protein
MSPRPVPGIQAGHVCACMAYMALGCLTCLALAPGILPTRLPVVHSFVTPCLTFPTTPQAFCNIAMQSASSAEGQARLALLAAVTLPHARDALALGRLKEARLVLDQGGVLPAS